MIEGHGQDGQDGINPWQEGCALRRHQESQELVYSERWPNIRAVATFRVRLGPGVSTC